MQEEIIGAPMDEALFEVNALMEELRLDQVVKG